MGSQAHRRCVAVVAPSLLGGCIAPVGPIHYALFGPERGGEVAQPARPLQAGDRIVMTVAPAGDEADRIRACIERVLSERMPSGVEPPRAPDADAEAALRALGPARDTAVPRVPYDWGLVVRHGTSSDSRWGAHSSGLSGGVIFRETRQRFSLSADVIDLRAQRHLGQIWATYNTTGGAGLALPIPIPIVLLPGASGPITFCRRFGDMLANHLGNMSRPDEFADAARQ